MANPDQPILKVGHGAGVCVAIDPQAAEAGAAMLRQGGNAFDAAVAAGFMEAVVSPHNCGIGGYAASGVGYLAREARVVAIDANAVAPARATPGMFPVVPARDPNDYRMLDSRHKQGPLSVAVPGVLGGLLLMLESCGRLDRKAVMAPAIERARSGPNLTPGQAFTWMTLKARGEGKPLPVRADVRGGIVPMPELAATLETIAEEGAAVFYAGRIGQAIADHVLRLGGILSREDMAGYRARVVEPVTVSVRGHTLATPPPGSGGLTSLQLAAIVDRLARSGKVGAAGSIEAFEAALETAKVVWEERLTELADPSTMKRPPQSLLTDAHLEQLTARVVEGLAHPGPGHLVAPDPLRGTVHLAAADRDGNVVAWTQTHGGGYGSNVMVPGLEVVLGHGMCRFDPRPGWANSIAPGKRPLHNMCPIVAVRDCRAVLAAGGSGGRTIVNNAAALLIGRLIFDLNPAAVVAAPRLQCETREPAVLERSAGLERIDGLRRRGHEVRDAARDAGNTHLISRDPQGWTAVAEPRLPSATVVVA